MQSVINGGGDLSSHFRALALFSIAVAGQPATCTSTAIARVKPSNAASSSAAAGLVIAGCGGGGLSEMAAISFHFIFVAFSFLFVRAGRMKMASTTISIDALHKMWAEIMFHPLMCGGGARARGSKDIPALHNLTPGLAEGAMTTLACGGSNAAQQERTAPH